MKKYKILIVEDEFIVAMDIAQVIESFGFEVAGIENDCTNVLRRNEELMPDLILMDINLNGDISGIELVKQIKDKYTVPIVYLTGQDDPPTLQKAYDTKPHGYILKPINKKDLQVTIENALQRFELEKQLMESEAKYRSYIENAPDGIFITDEKGNYLEVNDAACRITGYSREELKSFCIDKITAPEDRENALFHFEECKKTGKFSSMLKFINRNCEIRYWDVDTVKLSDTRYMGFARDVTEKVVTKIKLKEAEEKYRRLADNITENIWILDLGTFQFIYNSPSSEKLTGFSAEETYGMTVNDRLPPDEVEKMMKIISDELARDNEAEPDRIVKVKTRAFKKDGTLIWLEANVRFLRDINGKPVSLLGVTRSISDMEIQEK